MLKQHGKPFLIRTILRRILSNFFLAIVPILGTIVPNMGTVKRRDNTLSDLFGKTRRSILACLFSRDRETFYVRQIVRIAGIGQGTVQRELVHLAGMGLLLPHRRGNQVFYQANRNCPIFKELKSLIAKTSGIADTLKTALIPLQEQLRVAFIYGSIASGRDRAESDVDVILVGKVPSIKVVALLRPLQDTLGREINSTVYTPSEFKKKLSEDHPFIARIMNAPKILLIGNENDLKKLGK